MPLKNSELNRLADLENLLGRSLIISPLDYAELNILRLLREDPGSEFARMSAATLELSIFRINSPLSSLNSTDLAAQLGTDLKDLNGSKIILSKKEGSLLLRELGIRRISNKYLNRYLDNTTYQKMFGREVCKVASTQYMKNSKLVFTYGEIVYFYRSYFKKIDNNRLLSDPVLPESLTNYANEGKNILNR
jgi:hypothetical protein